MRRFLLFCGLVLIALGLRLYRLDALSLWLDEGGTWNEITGRSWGALAAELFSPRSSYPLYHLVMKAWVTLAGDSPWALRFPSAVAGGITVGGLYLLGEVVAHWRVGLWAAVLLLLHPVAVFQSQDAKVYSWLMALTLVSLLTLLYALQTGRRMWWAAWVVWVILGLFLHRLSLLSLIGQAALIVRQAPIAARWRRLAWLVPALLTVGLAVGMLTGLRQDPNAPPIGMRAQPLTAAHILLGRLNLDRTPADAGLWLVPLIVVMVFGIWFIWQPSYTLVRSVFGWVAALPLGIYGAILLAGTPIFEPRYVSFLVPFIALLLACGIELIIQKIKAPFGQIAALGVVGSLIAAQIWALFSAPYGLWSGLAIKEDYQGAMQRLAEHVVPQDVVVIHPAYIMPLYRYYAPRVSASPLPEPVSFGRAGSLGYSQGEFDNDYATLLNGHERAWLLIAPLNAALVDPPNPEFPQDDMGKIGINFLTADLNQKWRCTDEPYWAFNGVRLLCQSFPRQLKPGSLELRDPWPIPDSATATWADAIDLQGMQIRNWSVDAALRPGAMLPLAFHWQATQPLATRYRLFVHLLPAIGEKVAAQVDTEPLNGGLPTTQWPLNVPIHDELALPIPLDIQAGRYLVVAGWYDPTIPDVDTQRLAVTASSFAAGDTYVILGEVEVVP